MPRCALAVTGNGQSYDCPSIAASLRTVAALRRGSRTGSLTTAPPLRLLGVGVHRRRAGGTGSLTTAPPLRLLLGGRGRIAGSANGQSYDCPSIAAAAAPVARRAWLGNGQSYDCPSIAAPYSLQNALYASLNGQSYDCPSIAADADCRPSHLSHLGTGSLTTAPPLRRLRRGEGVGGAGERAVLRLPLHCGAMSRAVLSAVVLANGQSYDCPSIAAVLS